jgi:shikimate dehydrogenase
MESLKGVLRLDELETAPLPKVPLAVLGMPVAHSLSPAIHNPALDALASHDPQFADWGYVRVEVPIELLESAIPKLFARGFRGLNLTIPHKIRALDLITKVDPEVAAMGAVNTLLAREDGYWGTNTDGFGIARAIETQLGRQFGGSEVILLGAGGAARAIAVQALKDGVRKLWIGNRSELNLSELLLQIKNAGLDVSVVQPFLFSAPPVDLPSDALVINATSAGLKADDLLPLDLRFIGEGGAIYDTTYGVRNAWARWADAHGRAYADGLAMLIYQGQRSLEIWTGQEVSAQVMMEAGKAALSARKMV